MWTSVFIGIDQLIKWVIVSNVKLYEQIVVIPSLLCITHTKNTGAAFGMLKGMRVFFIIVTVVVLASVIVLLIKIPAEKFTFSWSTEVTDYIQVQFFPAIFNFADVCVVVGVALLCVKLLFIERKNANENSGLS